MLEHSRHYITPQMHTLLAGVKAATRAQAVFVCVLVAPRLAFLRDYALTTPGSRSASAAAVLPMAALLEMAVAAARTLAGEERGLTALSRAAAEQLLPLDAAGQITATVSNITGTTKIASESGAVLLSTVLNRVAAWEEPDDEEAPPAVPSRPVGLLERIARSAPALVQAQEGTRPLAAVQCPPRDGGDGFLQHPSVLSAALTLTDLCEDNAAADGLAMTAQNYLLSHTDSDTADSWAAAVHAFSATATADASSSTLEVGWSSQSPS